MREARILDQLSRAGARFSSDPFDARASLRPPRVPSELKSRPTAAPSPVIDSSRAPPPGPAVSGALEDVSLATLLGIFELERRDGVFRLAAPEGTVELELRRGAIVRARSDGQDSDVVTVLARAFDFRAAEFEFTRVPVTADSDAPLSLNGLLLDVFYRHDEARRAMGARTVQKIALATAFRRRRRPRPCQRRVSARPASPAADTSKGTSP